MRLRKYLCMSWEGLKFSSFFTPTQGACQKNNLNRQRFLKILQNTATVYWIFWNQFNMSYFLQTFLFKAYQRTIPCSGQGNISGNCYLFVKKPCLSPNGTHILDDWMLTTSLPRWLDGMRTSWTCLEYAASLLANHSLLCLSLLNWATSESLCRLFLVLEDIIL